jgi:hypothetical protein
MFTGTTDYSPTCLGLYAMFTVQAQYVVPRGGIFLGKWRTSFAGSSDCKMNVQSACTLNTRYFSYLYVRDYSRANVRGKLGPMCLAFVLHGVQLLQF